MKDKKDKLKVGVYALTSCYGCQLSIATVSKIVEIATAVDIKSFYMISSDSSLHDPVDVAFVEGSVSTEKDLAELKEIRKNAKILVAIGACAVSGGVQSWNDSSEELKYDDLFKEVYGDDKIYYQGLVAKPIDSFVKVDYFLPGCPPEEEEIIYFISTFLIGSYPEEKDYPVCQECRMAGNPCLVIEENVPCLGPITAAGCQARCISFNVPCIGCRGAVPHDTAWFDSLIKVFQDKKIDNEIIKKRITIFNSNNQKLIGLIDQLFDGGKKND